MKLGLHLSSGPTPTNPTPSAAPLPPPLNLPKWLETNSHLLRPPVNNSILYHHSGTTVMIVGGPNARSDYHINPTPEWFFQYRGAMVLKVVESYSNPEDPTVPCREVFRDIPIREGEMFLLPPNTPHNPIRFGNTAGLVIEQDRPTGMKDKLRWYCPNELCRKVVYEASFYCTDLGSQVKEAVMEFTSRPKEERVCEVCRVGVAGEKPVVKDINMEEKEQRGDDKPMRGCSIM